MISWNPAQEKQQMGVETARSLDESNTQLKNFKFQISLLAYICDLSVSHE